MATRIEDTQYQPPALWVRILETLVLTLAIPAIGWYFKPSDPLLLDEPFAWLIAGPLLVGLRYGFAFAFSSALITALLMIGAFRFGISGAEVSLQYVVGLILLSMITGEFTDVWHRRLKQVEIINRQQSTRLNEFVRNYHLLRTSHDQLAERVAANPYNLRDALLHLNQRFKPLTERQTPLTYSGNELLNFLAWHTKIQQAVLFAVNEHNQVVTPALANIGGQPEFDVISHPMVKQCLKKRCMISIKEALIQELELSDASVLAVVPLIDVDDRIWAIAVVTDVPFIMFHHDMLDLLAVLAANLGDVIREARQRATIWADDSHEPFIEKVQSWITYKRQYKLESLLMFVNIPVLKEEDMSQSFIELILGQLRGLDYPAVFDNGEDGKTLVILMPLTGQAAAGPYQNRISQLIYERFGINASEYGMQFYHRHVDKKLDVQTVINGISDESAFVRS